MEDIKYGLLTSRWLDIICKLTDLDSDSVHILEKKERGQYPAILTEQAWSIKDLLYGFRKIFFLRDKAGSPEHREQRSPI